MGVALGACASGLFLFAAFASARWHPRPCPPGDNECALELTVVRDWGRVQLAMGCALELLAAGLVLYLRGSEKKEPTP